jgi:hypothetical protein
MCIHFDHPTKKNEFEHHGELTGEGKDGKREGREGTAWGRHGGSCIGEGSRPFTRAALFMRALCSVASVCCVCSAPTWEEENSMKEKRRKRRKRIREGKKKKKMGKNYKHRNFWKNNKR